MNVVDFIHTITTGGAVGVLSMMVWLFLTGRIITRRELDACEARLAKTENMLAHSIQNTKRAVDLAEGVKEVMGGISQKDWKQ